MTDLNAMTKEQLIAHIAGLRAAPVRKITFKVTAPKLDERSGEMKGTSGAVSVYGLGRFPITLYRSQWESMFAAIPDLKAFMATNAALLATKD